MRKTKKKPRNREISGLLLARRKGLVAFLLRRNRGFLQCAHRRKKRATGTFLFGMFESPPLGQNAKQGRHLFVSSLFWHAGRDSNPQPSEPESDALSIEPPARLPKYYSKGRGKSKAFFAVLGKIILSKPGRPRAVGAAPFRTARRGAHLCPSWVVCARPP